MNRLRRRWEAVRGSFWLVPLLIVALSIVTAAGLVELDSKSTDLVLAHWPRLFGASADGARAMMSTIAASMMSVVGVTFSSVLVALALASSQYSSRVLRNFLGSRATQSVLGFFAGTFAYCLVVIRTIRSGDEGSFVPGLAVFFGFILAVCSVGLLLFYIHHISSSIQASSIIASVASEALKAVEALFPKSLGASGSDEGPGPAASEHVQWQSVAASESGYIQKVDSTLLLRIAKRHEAVIKMQHAIGEFVVEGTPLVSVVCTQSSSQALNEELHDAFTISRFRTVEQDIAFGIRQLVDVALKALSPGLNDVSTAVTCIDYLTTVLVRVAPRNFPSSHRYSEGHLRVITRERDFRALLDESFAQIRESAAGDTAIMMRLVESLQTIASVTMQPARREVLRAEVELIATLAAGSIEAPEQRTRVARRVIEARTFISKSLEGAAS